MAAYLLPYVGGDARPVDDGQLVAVYIPLSVKGSDGFFVAAGSHHTKPGDVRVNFL
jgi:hypothetical protein